jgi:streptogramin lyase
MPGEVVSATFTDARGYFRFIGIPEGEYRVRAQVPGKFVYFDDGKVFKVSEAVPVSNLLLAVAPFKKGTWTSYTANEGLPANSVRKIAFAPNGAVWLATDAGVACLDGREFKNVTRSEGLLDRFVNTLFVDAAGVVWIGSEHGVTRYDPALADAGTRAYTYLSNEEGVTEGVWSMVQSPEGPVWIATTGQLLLWDGRKVMPAPGLKGTVLGRLEHLALAGDGTLWIASRTTGLWSYKDGRARQFSVKQGLVTADTSYPFVSPRDGSVWCQAWRRGVARYVNANRPDEVPRFEYLSEKDGLISDNIEPIASDLDGNIWIGATYLTRGGVSRYDGTSFVNFDGEQGSVSGTVFDIQTGPDGTIWFASDRGLFRYDPDSLRNYSRADGLPQGPGGVQLCR